MSEVKFSVPKPCHENWDAMTPESKGRFCSACAKTVVDFTGMKTQEISDYLMANSGTKVCGRFENRQLSPEPLRIEIPRSVLFSQTSFRKMFVLALFVTMGTTLLSCKGHDDNTMMLGEPAIVDSTAKDEVILYGIDEYKTDSIRVIGKDTFHAVDREMVTGDVAYEPGDIPLPTPPPPKPIKPAKVVADTTTYDTLGNVHVKNRPLPNELPTRNKQ